LPERRYDIIHCHFGPNALVGLFARDAGILHGKLITTFHGYDVNTYPRKHGHDVYRRLFQRGDLFTANSRFTAGRAEALGCPKDKIVVLPVGVDLGDFKHTVRKATPGEEIRLLTVARLVEVKGIEYGIRAVARVTRSFPRIRYQIVGDGPMLTQLRELADNLGVAGSVDFLGGQTRDEVGRLYDRAHLFLLPGVVGSDGAQEGQGLVLLEAQACGIPVLATRVGGIPESVLDGDSGYLVGQRDVDALSKKLAHLIEHPELWPEMGRKGRALVEGKFDADSLHEQLVGIYQGVLKGA
jgi:colanic acid/amylovoran biosynthesis glycosyltransferase